MYTNRKSGAELGQFIGRDPWLVLGALGEQGEQTLASGSRITIPIDTELDVLVVTNTADGVAFTERRRVRLLESITAWLKEPLRVGYDVVYDEADPTLLTTNSEVEVGLGTGMRAVDIATGRTVESVQAGNAVLPAGVVVQKTSMEPVEPSNGWQNGGQQTAMPRADMNAIWKQRMLTAGYTAGGIALAGTVATTALAFKGRSGWAVGIGIVSSLAALTAVGVSMFSKAQIKAA